MTIDILRAEDRGFFDFGWLRTAHSFSFGSYFNPKRMGFGQLRVVNDDWVAPGQGFGTHPHRDMEIISIPLEGTLQHKDTLGNEYLIQEGEVQLMSAGTGIAHSEYNHSDKDYVNFLQIWIYPEKTDLEPSYQQKKLETNVDDWQTLVSPDGRDESLVIHQDAFVSLIETDKKELTYSLNRKEHGVFIFLLSGQIEIDNDALNKRDAVMLTDSTTVNIKLKSPSKILALEVPVQMMSQNNISEV